MSTRRLFEPISCLRRIFYNFQPSSMSPCHILAWRIPKDSKIYPAKFLPGEIVLYVSRFYMVFGWFFRVFSVYWLFFLPVIFHIEVFWRQDVQTCLENWDRREHMPFQPEKGRCMNLIYKANLIIKRIWSILVILGKDRGDQYLRCKVESLKNHKNTLHWEVILAKKNLSFLFSKVVSTHPDIAHPRQSPKPIMREIPL